MKTTKKWLAATMAALVVALSAMGLASCKMLNSLFGESSTQEHVCESICPICGKCMDLECTEDACLSKCLGHGELPDDPNPDDPNPDDPNPDEPVEEIPITGSTRYDFDAIAGYAKIENGKITSKEGVGSWIYDFTWTNNSSATLSVYSDKECESDVVIKVRKTAEVAVLTSKVTVSLNNTVLESEAKIAASSEGADAVFSEVNLGKFWLSEGVNEIKILPMDSTENFDFMSVILYTDADANLRWNDIKDVKGTFFYGVEEAVEITDGFGKNMAENCVGPNGANAYVGGSVITFPIYVSRDAKVNLSLITCTMPVNVVFTDLYGFYINDVQQHSNAYTLYGAAWGDYGIMELGEFELKEGLNKITISSPTGYGYTHHYNFRALIVDTDAKVAFTEVEKEAHVCLSVCPDCGGCLDLVCTETACVTKCSCAHECENVCGVCGACTNADCTEEACLTKCDCTVTTFNAVDDKAIITSGLSKNVDGNFVDVIDLSNLQKVTFTVYSESAQTVNLGFCISNNPTADWTLVDYFRVWVNVAEDAQDDTNKLSKETYTAKTIQGEGSVYNDIMIGNIELTAGDNTITLGWTCVGNVAYKFTVRSMLIQSANAVEWGTVVHKCESICSTCNGCMDMNCEEEACATKCTCGHECENVCGVCGACTNVNCTEVICATKCGCESSTYLAGTESVIEQGKVDNDGNLGCLTLDDNSWRTKFYYVVNAETAGKAELSIVISSTTGGTYAATDVYMTTINGEKYTSDASTVNDGVAWFNYHTIKLGLVELKAGKNVIAFDHYHITDFATAAVTNWGESVNFQSIILKTSVKYTVGHDVCLSKCDFCGGCMDKECAETVCATKCTCTLNTFYAVDEKVVISSGLSKNVDGNFVDVTDLSNLQKVTFTIYSESAQTVNLGFCISNNPTASWVLVDYFRVWVNVEDSAQDDTNKLSKDTYTAPTIQGDGSVYNDIMIGNIELKEGNNTITLGWTCVGSEAYKFTVRSMLMHATKPVTLVTAA